VRSDIHTLLIIRTEVPHNEENIKRPYDISELELCIGDELYMGKLLTKDDITYENHNFWWHYLLLCRGFDDEKELNLDDAVRDVIDEKKAVPDILAWHREFCPKDGVDRDGYYEDPNFIAGNLKNGMSFAIEFHAWHINYYLNDIYIGNLGGHFEAWFLTWNELLAFDRYDYLFLLLLPMTGIDPNQREQAEQLICEKLKEITLFSGHEPYVAKCIANGLVIEGVFEEVQDIGLTSHTNHSVRNIEKYPRYTEDVIALNKALKGFLSSDQ